MSNKNMYVLIGVAVVVLALIALYFGQKSETEPAENDGVVSGQTSTASKTEDKFSGTVSAVDTGCFADAVCSVTVDGKKIILVQGGLAMNPNAAVGRLIGVGSIGEIEGRMGAFANVYVGITPEGDYTLYGNSDYYVEIVPESNK